MSLYDLIYSQPSQSQQELSQEDGTYQGASFGGSDGDDKAYPLEQSQKDDDAVLNDFYSQEQSPPPPSANDGSKAKQGISSSLSQSPAPSAPPRIKKRARDELTYQEQLEQEQIRSQNRNKQREWGTIRHRWKYHKKHDLRDEDDYGAAVETVSQLHKNRTLKRSRDGTKSGTPLRLPNNNNGKKTTGPTAIRNGREYKDSSSEGDDDDGNDKEEHLGSLVNETQNSNQNAAPEEITSQHKDWSHLSYWKRGYMAPNTNKGFTYGVLNQQGDRDGDPLVVLGRADQTNDIVETEEQQEPVTLGNLQNSNCVTGDHRYYFPYTDPLRCPTTARFFHERNLIRIAARCIVGGCHNGNDSDEAALQNRLLRALYHKSQSESHRVSLLISQAKERAMDLGLFYTHDWGENRAFVLEEIGLGRKHEMLGPPRSLDYTMRYKTINATWRDFRKRVAKKNSRGKAVLTFETQTEMEPGLDDFNSIEGQITEEGTPKTQDSDTSLHEDTTRRKYKRKRDTVAPQAKFSNAPLPRIQFPHPETVYMHVPGTIPPVPSFPLDENAIFFGPPDETNWYWHSADIEEVTYSLTMSVLLSRLGRARLNNSSSTSRKAYTHVMDYLKELPERICVDRRHLRMMGNINEPVVPLYMAVMGYCNFVANNGAASIVNSNGFTAKNDESEEDDYISSMFPKSEESTEETKIDTMNIVARRISDHCKHFKQDVRLAPFPRIHLIMGIAAIAEQLPPQAAEILSRPCDTSSSRTPFDLIRMTLEYLEKNDLLLDKSITVVDEGKINAAYLEIAFHNAIKMFSKCLKLKNTEVIYHEWYVGALAGSMLLQSGNRIGGGARRRPSTKEFDGGYSQHFSQSSFLDSKNGRTNNYGARTKLDNFHNVRKETMEATLALIKLASRQKVSRVHLAISSFMEWNEVIALLVGPHNHTTHHKSEWAGARRLHAHHSVQWAIQEKSDSSLHRLEDLQILGEVNVDTTLEVIAGMVENDAGNPEQWKRLIVALGPVGTTNGNCMEKPCHQCKRLRHGLNINHNALKERKEKLGWWGESRTSWWDTHLLQLPTLVESVRNVSTRGNKPTRHAKTASKEKAKHVFLVSAAIEKHIAKESGTGLPVVSWAKELCGVGIAAAQEMDLSWLQSHDDPEIENKHDKSNLKQEGIDVDEADTYDSELPKKFHNVITRRPVSLDNSDPPFAFPDLASTRQGQVLEAFCVKLLVICHLYDMTHPTITEGVWLLARRTWQKQQHGQATHDCDEWHSLKWLSTMGLNIPRILHYLYTHLYEKEQNVRARKKLARIQN